MRLLPFKIIVLASVILTVNACKCNNTQNPGGKNAVYVYPFQKTPPITAEDSKKMVTDFLGIEKVHDLTVNKDENIAYFVADDNVNTTFEENLTNGNFAFSKLPESYMSKASPQLPSVQEAQKIAEDFLVSKKLAPRQKGEMRLVHTGGVRSQAVINGQQGGPITDKLITFTYGRVVDSLPVIGPGSKIIINVGDKGEIVGMTRRWRELNTGEKKEVKPEEMITQKEAEEKAGQQIRSEFGENTNFEITRTTKSYYDDNGNILQPVWAFEATLNLNQQDKNLQPAKYLAVIPMMKNSPEPLQLQTLDPRAKELIKTVQPGRDSTQIRGRDSLPND